MMEMVAAYKVIPAIPIWIAILTTNVTTALAHSLLPPPVLSIVFFRLKSEQVYLPFHELPFYFKRYGKTTYEDTLDAMLSLFQQPTADPTVPLSPLY